MNPSRPPLRLDASKLDARWLLFVAVGLTIALLVLAGWLCEPSAARWS